MKRLVTVTRASRPCLSTVPRASRPCLSTVPQASRLCSEGQAAHGAEAFAKIALGGLALVCGLTLAGCRKSETAAPASAAAERFSGERALEQVTRLVALGERVSGTPGAERAAQWLAAELRALGLRTRIEEFTDEAPGGPVVFRNVIGIVPGAGARRVLLVSHYDTKAGIENFAGANDSGSSTGLLLEFARVMRDAPAYPFDLWLCFVDGEECVHEYGEQDGLHGSRHLAQAVLDDGAPLPSAVIVLDMIGDRDLNAVVPPNTTPALAALALRSARRLGLADYLKPGTYGVLDDHVPFLERGLPALLLIDFEFGSAPGRNDYWHTPEDSLDKISARSLEIAGRITLDLLQHLPD